MHEFALLRDLLVLIAIAIPAVALAQRVNVPSVLCAQISARSGPCGQGRLTCPSMQGHVAR